MVTNCIQAVREPLSINFARANIDIKVKIYIFKRKKLCE